MTSLSVSVSRSLLLYRLQVRGGKFDDRTGVFRNPRNDEITDVFDRTKQELTHVLPLFQQRVDLPEQRPASRGQKTVGKGLEAFRWATAPRIACRSSSLISMPL